MPAPVYEERRLQLRADPAALFRYLDDPRHLGEHMQRRRGALAGGSLRLQTDARRGLGLLTETGAERGVVRERRFEQLDRDTAAEAGVGAGVDIGHSAAPEQFADLVAAGEQTHVCRHPICHDRLIPRVCRVCPSKCNRRRSRERLS